MENPLHGYDRELLRQIVEAGIEDQFRKVAALGKYAYQRILTFPGRGDTSLDSLLASIRSGEFRSNAKMDGKIVKRIAGRSNYYV